MSTPRASYRLQLSKHFGFAAVARIAPYLASLGISHVYTSPYLQARSGSEHGYDVTNHNKLNFELGDESAFREMIATFRRNSLEHILDFVPNHMGVGGSDNPLWLDTMEWGKNSPYSSWFDINWNFHGVQGKLLVPFLGGQYGVELEAGKLSLRFDPDNGEFAVWLYDTHKLPVTPPTYSRIFTGVQALRDLEGKFTALESLPPDEARESAICLKKELSRRVSTESATLAAIKDAMDRFRGIDGDFRSWNKLRELIEVQHWRPAHFRVASDDINYRRFFNISELAGIRMELPKVFKHAHRLILDLVRNGSLQGLRIDHIDGLYDPKEYLDRLRTAVGDSFYIVVEKILANSEMLQPDWPIDGTTGYDFCNQVLGLFVDPTAVTALTDFYGSFTGEATNFPQIVRECKLTIMENELASEVGALSQVAERVARQNPKTADFTGNILHRALREIIACFPLYRTYVRSSRNNQSSDRYIHWAVSVAAKLQTEIDPSTFTFLEALLHGRLSVPCDSQTEALALNFAMRVQQLSGPIMAKGVEDTAYYRYNRLIALNEVGGSPHHFGYSVAQFHKANQHRAEKWPRTMLCTSTHDTKHGEDARIRSAALSLIPKLWTARVCSWSRLLRARRGDIQAIAPPSRNEEYLFFQKLVASWPSEPSARPGLTKKSLARYCERVQQAQIKSLREARVHTNWIAPDKAYEDAVSSFIADALDAERSAVFLKQFLPIQRRLARLGMYNSLVQVALKICSPGVPDFYQGSELWDLSFQDPDNRAPVDFELRMNMLERVEKALERNRVAAIERLLRNWQDGGVKLAVMKILLDFRKANKELFDSGSYEPLQALDLREEKFCAFRRRFKERQFVLAASLDPRQSTRTAMGQVLVATNDSGPTRWRDVLTGKTFGLAAGYLAFSNLFSTLPVVALVPEDDGIANR